MQKRALGNTGDTLSLIGLGGVVYVQMDQQTANELTAEAVERGVNYFDVAPSYGKEQETELRMGEALKPYRDSVFLACKTTCRNREGAERELNQSLKNLQTDRFDLYQLHAISSVEEVKTCFAVGGAMEAVLAAQAAGKIRHIGFSAHSAEAALYAMDTFPFVSALFPINFVTWSRGNFGPQIMAKAEEKGVARLALKAMARTNWAEGAERSFPHCWYEPLSDPHQAQLALRYTLSQNITAAVPPGDPRLFRLALEIAERFNPLTNSEESELLQIAEQLAPIFQAA